MDTQVQTSATEIPRRETPEWMETLRFIEVALKTGRSLVNIYYNIIIVPKRKQRPREHK